MCVIWWWKRDFMWFFFLHVECHANFLFHFNQSLTNQFAYELSALRDDAIFFDFFFLCSVWKTVFFLVFFLSYRFATYQLCISNFQPVDFFSTLKALKLQCTCIPFHMYLCSMNEKMALNIIQVLLLLLSNCAN